MGVKSQSRARRRMTGWSEDEKTQLLSWAQRSLHGLDDSAYFLGIFDNKPISVARVEFLLQLGHALLNNKPIILTVPHGYELPPKLLAAAERIVYYDPGDPQTIQHALTPVLTELGVNRQ